MPNSVESYDYFNEHCVSWKLHFALLPRTCYYTEQRIWLEYGYKGTAMWHGPGTPVIEHRFISVHSWLMQKIKGSI